MSFDQYITSKPLESLNLELTSKCALQCPRCARILHKGTYKITELSLDLIKQRLQPDILKELNYIDLSGNYGDPIYHKHFLDILKYLKSQNPKEVYIETNGSGKNTSFWQEVVSILDDKDVITFSVDGLEDTNSIYRINSKWDSIYSAMEIVSKSKVQADWKFIVFKHNQHQIKRAQQLSKQLGISQFIIVKSTLFGKGFLNKEGLDPLKPEEKWIKSSSPLSHSNKLETMIRPKCLIKGLHYISAEGHYFPCCWIGHYHIAKALFSEKEMQSLSLHKHSLTDIFKSSALKKLEKSWKNISQTSEECKQKCGDNTAQKNKSNSFHEKNFIQNF